MHFEKLDALANSDSKDKLLAEFVNCANILDFAYASITLETVGSDGRPHYSSVCNAPESYLSIVHDPEAALSCPVHSHLRSSIRPIVYDQKTFETAQVMDLWDQQAPFGYKVGIATNVIVPGVGKIMAGFDGDALPKSSELIMRAVADLQLAVGYAQETICKILAPTQKILTPQQQVVLELIATGKSNSVIAQLTNTSSNTISYHVKQIYARLDVSTRQQAVLKASKMGLLPSR